VTAGRRVILIAGPTASGKSAVAIALAERLGGVVINADSMQVYRDLRVLSARPSAADEARAPHALYGFVDAAEAYSTGKWLEAVATELDKAAAASRVAIVTGGTGLYFRGLEQGLAPMPAIPDDVRRRWRARLEALGPAALHADLERVDPQLARRLTPGDSQRLVRAHEVMEATGRSLLAWQTEAGGGGVLGDSRVVRFVLTLDREELYRRCDLRFDRMIEAGAIAEVDALRRRRLDPRLPAMKALGVPQLMAHLEGEIDLEEAAATAKMWTRRYAKRQLTWFRGNMIAWNEVQTHDSERILAKIFPILDDRRLTTP
jgi:tRNA dimethylallyltransferase